MLIGVAIGLGVFVVALFSIVLLVPPDAPPGYGYSKRKWWLDD